MKMRRWDISIFTGICLFHLVANTPLMGYIMVPLGTGWYAVSQWIYFWPSTAGGKALAIIDTLGIVSVGVRGMIGMERGIFSSGG